MRAWTSASVDYTATTGEGENVKFATGHFYSMTTHARGGVFLHPGANAVVDIGALNGRAIYVDARGKVLSYKMTSQCASGSGQFLENIARYLGVAVEEIGPLSQTSQNPEKVSSICAVLAETDVINMVSRGIATPDILKGIHLSMASRIVKLLKVTGIKEGTALLTGGLALDGGLLAAISEEMTNEKVNVDRAQPSGFDLRRRDRRRAVGRISPRQAARALANARPPERRTRTSWHCSSTTTAPPATPASRCAPTRRSASATSSTSSTRALHRVRRRRGRAAMQARVPGRLHRAEPGLPGIPGRADGEVRVAARLTRTPGARFARGASSLRRAGRPAVGPATPRSPPSR